MDKIECPIRTAARLWPDRIALSDHVGSISYAELDARINASVARLYNENITSGETIAVLGRNSIEQIILFFAAMRMKCLLLPLNWRLTGTDWKTQLQECRYRFLCYDQLFETQAVGLTDKAIPLHQLTTQSTMSIPPAKADLGLDNDTLVIFTSGSQDRPKGVVLTCGNLYYSALGTEAVMPLSSEDSWLAVLPFFHIGGLLIPFRTALAGCRTVVMPAFDPTAILSMAVNREISIMSVVPSMLQTLIEGDHDNRLSGLRAIILGGDRISDRLRQEIVSRSLPVLTSYGMTETASMVTLLPLNAPLEKLATSGKILPYRKISVQDDSGAILPNGESGRIMVRGKTMFSRYIGERSATLTTNGWFATQDCGWLDDDAYLSVTGRVDRVIISGGEKIDLDYLENAVREIVGVSDAAVLVRTDPQWGQRPVVFIETEDKGLLEEKFRQILSATVPRLMMPDKIMIIAKIPRTPLGKINRPALVRQFPEIFGTTP